MQHGIEITFDSIESAHEFVGLLTEAVVEAKRDIEADVPEGIGLEGFTAPGGIAARSV